jgi:Ca2+-binding RTX toxin-like protein
LAKIKYSLNWHGSTKSNVQPPEVHHRLKTFLLKNQHCYLESQLASLIVLKFTSQTNYFTTIMANPSVPTSGLLDLSLLDLAFLQTQVTLPGNVPVLTTDATGIRDVRGFNNNVFFPSYGSADTPFTRLTFNAFTTIGGGLRNSGASWNNSTTNPGNLGSFNFNWGSTGSSLNYSQHAGGFYQLGAGSVAVYDPNYIVDYSVRNSTIVDTNPRIISNIISDQNDQTLLAVQDNPSSTPGGRINPLSGAVNPLAYSSYFTLVGQFFDHGLDFVHKGNDGVVITPILPGDPLYLDPTTHPNARNYFTTSRTNTIDGESINTVSPYVDLSQSYGSVFTHTVFLKEWKIIPGDIVTTGYLLSHQNTISSNGEPTALDGGQATWTDVKANASKLGLTLRDYNVNDIPQLRQNADGSLYQDPTTHQAFFVAKDASGNTVYIQDTSLSALTTAGLTLVTTGHAFLDDQSAYALAAPSAPPTFPPGFPILTADGDNPVGYNAYMQAFFTSAGYGPFNGIDGHFISGDGRTNENIGLTAIHEVFHNEHQYNVDIIKNLGQFTDNGNGTWTAINATGGTDIWTGEQLFQAAKILTEGEYQHMIFAEFARKYSPNIDDFANYNITLNPNISSEFAMAVYRLGHSQLTETVQRGVTDPVTGKITLVNDSLFDDFLNPSAYTTGHNATAAEIAVGMSLQTGNAIDEWVTDTLRNHLVKNKEDLATRNIVRGRDSGTPSLNDTRASLYQQTGIATLKPYDSWNEFKNNLLHGSDSLQEFIMAYAHDDILTNAAYQSAISAALGASVILPTTLAEWGAFQLANPDTPAVVGANGINTTATVDGAYTKALKAAAAEAMIDSAFMNGGNKDFWNIDLWIGGLAESKVDGGMLGSTFDAVFATQMNHLQNGDRLYYITRFKLSANVLDNIDTQLLSDIVMRNTGAKHLYSDIFSVPDNVVEMSDYAKALNTYASVSALEKAVKDNGVLAGWVGNTFYSNPGDYKDSRGLVNQNGYGNASEVVGGTDAAESINSAGGNDTDWGDGGDDTIDGGTGFNYLHGGDGNDVIRQTESGMMWGDAGNDTIYGGSGRDEIFGGNGNDSLQGNGGADRVTGGKGNDRIYGDSPTNFTTGGADILDGDTGNDTLWGQRGNDIINGGEGNDEIRGGADQNVLLGFSGNDTFIMDENDVGLNNAINGGIGHDTADFRASRLPSQANTLLGINVDLGNVGAGAIAPLGISVRNTWVSVEEVYATNFNDTVSGGVGIQVDDLGNPILGANGLPLPVDYTFHGVDGNDSLTGGTLLGGNDSLFGDNGNDTLIGLEGNDLLDGGLGNDRMVGGVGNDTYFIDSATDVVVEAAGAGIDWVNSSVTHTLVNAENLILRGTTAINGIGNAVANIITGNNAANTLVGNGGNDTLMGNDGNDVLWGGTGADSIEGGNGTDLASYYYSVGSVTVNLTTNVNTGGDAAGDSLINIENVQGSLNAISNLTGNSGNNVLYGYNGSDILNGEAGIDVLYGGAGDDSLNGGANIDYLYGQAGDDTLNGDAGNDVLYGGAGSDVIDGGADVDLVSYYNFVGTTLTVSLTTPSSNTGDAAGDSYTNIENLQGSLTAANNLTGNSGNNVLYAYNSSDILNGEAGNDVLYGGAGSDSLNGGANIDYLYGQAGDDSLDGGDQTDVLYGGAGNDILNGGNGLDYASYYTSGTTGQTLSVSLNPSDSASNSGDATGDTFISIEYLQGSLVANNRLTGDGNNNNLYGYSGNDTLKGDGGNDYLSSGTGNDEFMFAAGAVSTNVVALLGTDTLADFAVGTDKIVLSQATFSTLTAGSPVTLMTIADDTAATLATAGFSSSQLIYSTGSGRLYYNANGTNAGFDTGVGGNSAFAILSTKPTLVATDIVVIV